jgi:predicted RNA binding protein YcfA (HicA-like mRNA interferase family)
MSKIRRISGAEAVRAFARAGFVVDRVKGSHHILKKKGHRYVLSIPVHAGKNLGTGLVNALIEASGLSVDEFAKLL